jgi:hypothetical protein
LANVTRQWNIIQYYHYQFQPSNNNNVNVSSPPNLITTIARKQRLRDGTPW